MASKGPQKRLGLFLFNGTWPFKLMNGRERPKIIAAAALKGKKEIGWLKRKLLVGLKTPPLIKLYRDEKRRKKYNEGRCFTLKHETDSRVA